MQRKTISAELKSKVALEAIRGQKTTNELAKLHSVHPTQVGLWKKQLLDEAITVFSKKREDDKAEQEILVDNLYQQIGRLKVELDFLKKNLAYPLKIRRGLVESEHPQLSVLRQCELLGLPRASYYYRPEHDGNGESDENLFFMRLLDEQFTKTPFYGVEKMTFWLRTQGHMVNPKRVRRLLRKMGLEAIYPKPNLSKANPEHKIYPYLLRGVKIERINQVWSCDITYGTPVKGPHFSGNQTPYFLWEWKYAQRLTQKSKD